MALGMDKGMLCLAVTSSATFLVLVPALTDATSFGIIPSGALAIAIAFVPFRKTTKAGETV